MGTTPNDGARPARLPGPTRGALYMSAAACGFAMMSLGVRAVSAELDPLEIAFLRNLFATLFMLPWFLTHTGAKLRTFRLKLYLWRAAISLCGMLLWFSALALLPLAEAVALNFTVPLFTTAGAALLLGETVRWRRWSATAAGFAGVLIILRPGFQEITPTMLLPVAAAGFMAVATMMVKTLSRTERPGTIVLYLNLLLTPLSLLPALFVWQWPSLAALALTAIIGALGALSHFWMTRAYAATDASLVAPFDYSRLLFVALFGYLAFGEVPGSSIWIGGAVIAASALYIARRETQLARQTTAVPLP